MKKFLPALRKFTLSDPEFIEGESKGFTLIELLIVVAIIAVLSVISIIIFSGLQENARDARRKEDVNTIANAMEVNYGKVTAGQYKALANNMFSSGAVPIDPVNTNTGAATRCPGVCKYCAREGANAAAIPVAACSTANTIVAPNTPEGGSTNPYWIICTNLEGGAAGAFYCRGNQQ